MNIKSNLKYYHWQSYKFNSIFIDDLIQVVSIYVKIPPFLLL